MAYKRCGRCGVVNNLDQNPECCKACGARFDSDDQQAGASTAFSSLAEAEPPATTGGEVESFGAYGRAADAAWVDPAERVHQREEEVNLDVPDEILRMHKAKVARRNNLIGIAVAVLGALILFLVLASR